MSQAPMIFKTHVTMAGGVKKHLVTDSRGSVRSLSVTEIFIWPTVRSHWSIWNKSSCYLIKWFLEKIILGFMHLIILLILTRPLSSLVYIVCSWFIYILISSIKPGVIISLSLSYARIACFYLTNSFFQRTF